ncbi:hypothetical protein K438DRAFT_1854271 [Mycena galopus ATCC 62051]|nr:hypothetical protein K438DRAFT_1854271 [Mycena galopus ATCC 62051]
MGKINQQQGLRTRRTGVARFFRSLWCVGSGDGDNNSTLYSGSEESTLVNCDAICHIQRLPDPVLGAIFALSKDAEKKDVPTVERAVSPVPVEWVVSQVAVRWRVVALGLPELWSSVDARVRPTHQRALLEWYLAHSSGRPLDVRISLSQENWDPEGQLLLAAVLAEAQRLRRLSIRVDFLAADAAVREACRRLCAPLLEHFSFISLELPYSWREPDDHIYEEDFTPVVFTRGVARLAVLRLQHLQGAMYPPLGGVTTLHLEEYHCPAMAYTRFHALLRVLPALANLSLYGTVVAGWPAAKTLSLPNLRALRCAGSDQVGSMLVALDAPGLEELTLKDVCVGQLWSGSRYARRLPALRTLVLDGFLSARALSSVLCEMGDSVEELRLVNCDADDALQLLARGGPGKLLPGLREVMVHHLHSTAALDRVSARELAIRAHVDVPWTGMGTIERWTRLPPWPAELDCADADDLFMQLRRRV